MNDRLTTMVMLCRGPLLAVLLTVGLVAQALEDEWQGVERVVAIGDVHGDYDNYLLVLQEAGVVNRRGKWSGGKTHLVQVGDVPDRGPDTDRIIEHLMKLEKQARRAGGRVHALIGNHEAMNIVGDLRYVDPGEYAALKSGRARALREDYFQKVLAYLSTLEEPPVIDEAFREEWLNNHPLGFVEHRQFWHPQGEFGSWVTGHNAVIKINNMLFLHGGVSAAQLDMSLGEINDRVREELLNPNVEGERITESADGPLWYRGLARPPAEGEEPPPIAALLEHFGVDHIVVGHTPGYGTVVPRFGMAVLVIDAGIADHYGGHRASLLAEGDRLYTIQRGERIPIPSSEEGLLDYYQSVAVLEPDVINLRYMIQQLQNPVVTDGNGDPSVAGAESDTGENTEAKQSGEESGGGGAQ